MTADLATTPHGLSERLAAWHLLPDGALLTTRSSWILPVLDRGAPALLKVARIPDEEAGYRLMAWWDGEGAARVLASAPNALLLERGEGGGDLARMARSGQDDRACRILCDTAARLHAVRARPWPALHALAPWFEPLFQLSTAHARLAPAVACARALLAAPRDVGPLHGDLHHDNVLDFGARGWLAIDPHGLVGERTFDYANIFTNPDLGDPTRPIATLPGRFETRLGVVLSETGFEAHRLLQCIVAWTGLSAAWFIEDGDDAGAAIDLVINDIAQGLIDGAGTAFRLR